MLTALLLLASAVEAAPPGPVWATFSRNPALTRAKEEVEIGSLGFNHDTKQPEYWMRRTVTTIRETQISWTDSRSCPAVRSTIVAMERVAVPRPQTPESPGTITVDGIHYRLEAPSADGRITFDGNVGSSVGAWIDTSLSSLEKCWNDHIPQR